MTTELAPWRPLLPALITDDPDEQAVTESLLAGVDLEAELEGLVDGLADLLEHATAAATRRAYESDRAHFAGWANRLGLSALPAEPQTVALYLTAHENTLSPATLVRRLSAIAVAHREAGLPSPASHELVRRAVAGIRKKHGARPAAKTALVTAQLAVICTKLDREATVSVDPLLPARRQAQQTRVAAAAALRARRDKALLLVGYAAALRRSELVALDVDDLRDSDGGLTVFVARSKTDQAGLGDFVGIAHGHPPTTCTGTCPIRAWHNWRSALATAAGGGELPPTSPAFRPITRHGHLGSPTDQLDQQARLTGQSVAAIVKRAVALLNEPTRFPPAQYAGHSLRAGFATQAAAVGVPLDRIMRQTRHASIAVAMRYIREADLWNNNPSAALGL